ncbi:hypothetical protein A2cp1_1911 [Anaeromyxobacter dehalogenans 2CP-1]|uniref:HEAT repeat domain-containing protein n=1 Tax=Anaeromyxobacter dehalogenans (strain ATCC BAA-258 / DSM 21875 / 2CP-1) TaxID=455488 RepID=B8J763_ANAD2|nr:HEAT repeat domain-containing protein [Anaeromyxobacter dehalogenans]ACL65253.1 hypothetical protein A2cp1_1911 [Anaeromyxobacter dehalogenans 2CP-1]
MPTENEIRVMKLLTATDLSPSAAAEAIVEWGNEAVTVVCEAALGQYPGLRLKVRTNAAALLGWIDHPQATEAIDLLIQDSSPDLAVRAIRAAGRKKDDRFVSRLGEMLERPETTPILAAEAVRALVSIGSARAQSAVGNYEAANPRTVPHRASRAVADVLEKRSAR